MNRLTTQGPKAHRLLRSSNRRGSVTIFAAVLLTALVILGGVCINLTQLSMAKTEVRLACDAAAKAGAVVLGQSQSPEQARAAARQVAAAHRVNGQQILLREVDVILGNSEANTNGRFTFRKDVEPLNSVRVMARMTDNGGTAPGQYFFTGLGDSDQFSLQYEAIATRVDHDLCLVVDRSGSMCWDMSNQPWHYPVAAADSSIMQNYFLPPHPTLSRWSALTRATSLLFDEIERLPIQVNVGMVSYSSNFVFGLYRSDASTIESNLTDNYDSLQARLMSLGGGYLIGNTNVASGMQSAVRVLTDTDARLTAKKTMVVLTDGIWNQGVNPVDVASAAAAANITVHTITFSAQADQPTMQAVAAAGSGTHYHAPDEATLRTVFSRIVATLPAVLTK